MYLLNCRHSWVYPTEVPTVYCLLGALVRQVAPHVAQGGTRSRWHPVAPHVAQGGTRSRWHQVAPHVAQGGTRSRWHQVAPDGTRIDTVWLTCVIQTFTLVLLIATHVKPATRETWTIVGALTVWHNLIELETGIEPSTFTVSSRHRLHYARRTDIKQLVRQL